MGEILAGKRGITADTGLRLSRALGRSDMFWINLQARYDADLVRIEKSEASAARRCVLSQWIRQTRSQCRSQPLRRGASPEAALGAQRLDDDLSNRPPKLFDPAKELQGCFDYLRRYGGS